MFQALQDGIREIGEKPIEPKAVMSDACIAIKNAFENVFKNEYVDLTCWFHMKKALKENIKELTDDQQKEILEDVDDMHIAYSPELFKVAIDLFKKNGTRQNIKMIKN